VLISRGSYKDINKHLAGFSFSKGKRDNIKRGILGTKKQKNLKSDRVDEGSESWVETSDHRTEESLLTENKEVESSQNTVVQRQIWDGAINMELEDVRQT
jgi:hypothetical protein